MQTWRPSCFSVEHFPDWLVGFACLLIYKIELHYSWISCKMRLLEFFFGGGANFEALFIEGYLSLWSRKFCSIHSKEFSNSAPWRGASARFRCPTGIWRYWNMCPYFLEAAVLGRGPQFPHSCARAARAQCGLCQTLVRHTWYFLLVVHLCLTALGSCRSNIGQNCFL